MWVAALITAANSVTITYMWGLPFWVPFISLLLFSEGCGGLRWSGLFRQLVGEFKVDSCYSLELPT